MEQGRSSSSAKNPQGPAGLVCYLFLRWIEGREDNKNICMLFLFFLITSVHFGTNLGGVGGFCFSLQILLPFTFFKKKRRNREGVGADKGEGADSEWGIHCFFRVFTFDTGKW